MSRKKRRFWVEWFDKQNTVDQRTMALAAIERLIEIGEVEFRVDERGDECLYWDSCGEDLRIPF